MTDAWQAKGLDPKGEHDITQEVWIPAAEIAVRELSNFHGAERAAALADHHPNVLRLVSSFSRPIMREYDIQQRNIWAGDPRHDISMMDHELLTVIAAKQMLALQRQQSASGSKRARDASERDPSSSPRKRPAGNNFPQPMLCFRCGNTGHLPASCSASTTVAGKAAAPLMGGAPSNSLRAPSGQCYCFNFARSSSRSYTNSCRNVHACSICQSTENGARACTARA